MPDLIDMAADNYAKAWEAMLAEVVKRYGEMTARFTHDEIIEALASDDFVAVIADQFGLNKATSALVNEYTAVLGSMKATAPLSDEMLSALVKIDMNLYSSINTKTAAEIQKQLSMSVIGNQTEAEFAQALKTATLRTDQANALASDTLRNFSRSVEAEMAQERPEQKYIWSGPVDDRTSDECLALISEGPMTFDEFEQVMPGAFQSGTHFNCRHEPQPVVRERQVA